MKINVSNNNIEVSGGNYTMQKKYTELLKAYERLESDLEFFANKAKFIPNGHHLWATNWYPLRLDDLEGLASEYYIISLIDDFSKNYNQQIITVEGDLQNHFVDYLKRNYPKIIVKRIFSFSQFVNNIRTQVSPIKYLIKCLKFRNKTNNINAQIWMSSSFDIEKHRYRHLLFAINGRKAYFTGRLEKLVVTKYKEESINFREYVNFTDIKKSFVSARKLNRWKKKNKPKTLIDFAIRDNKFQHIFGTIVKEKSIDNALDKNQPTKILFTTANTYSTARIVARQAYLKHIPFIIVACRPMFTKSRLEERLAHPDLLKINDAHVGDYYAVWDKYSKKTLIEQGIKAEKIFITSGNVNVNTLRKQQVLENALLLLFSHEKKLNSQWISELQNLYGTYRIIIREHPLMPLTSEQKLNLNDKFDVIKNITSLDYTNYKFINVIALTVNSTAIIEAVKNGCGAIWMPYLNNRSLLFYEIMMKMGVVMKSYDDLNNFLTQKDSIRIELIKKCQESYLHFFDADDETFEFLQQMKLA